VKAIVVMEGIHLHIGTTVHGDRAILGDKSGQHGVVHRVDPRGHQQIARLDEPKDHSQDGEAEHRNLGCVPP